MSETDTYYRYNHARVLLETSRIYRPVFAPAVVQLTGAQVEMLRNMTQYLNRPNTYVEEYEVDKYLTPDAGQFDGIQAIVADLEEKLMGNENVIWGYNDRLAETKAHTMVSGTTYDMDFDPVPAGEVHRVLGFTLATTKTGANVLPYAFLDGGLRVVYPAQPLTADVYVAATPYDLILKEGDYMQFNWSGLVVDDYVIALYWGYKMTVPV